MNRLFRVFKTSLLVMCLAVATEPKESCAVESDSVHSTIRKLGDSNPKIRDQAEIQLQSMGTKVFTPLFDATFDKDLEIARRAIRLLFRLDRDAIGPLRKIAIQPDQLRGQQAQRLLDALSDRIIQAYREDLAIRLDAAAKQNLVTYTEQLSWISQIGSQNFLLDEKGKPLPTAITIRLAAREVVPSDLNRQQSPDAEELQRFTNTGEFSTTDYVAAWKQFSKSFGDDVNSRTFFASMINSEPILMKAIASSITAKGSLAEERAGLVVGGIHDFRSTEFVKLFRESFKSIRPQQGQIYPPTPNNQMLATFSALTFAEIEVGTYIPSPTLQATRDFLTRGMAGYLGTKQPVYELVRVPKTPRDKIIRQLIEKAVLSAKNGADLESALTIGLYYRLRGPCLTIAGRVLEMEPVYESTSKKMQTQLLAGHALFVHGRGSESALNLSRKLLDRAEQVRLAGYRKEQNRLYVELREFGLMSVLRILGKKSSDIGGTSKVTGYCPIKRFTNFDAIRDSKRWDAIIGKVDAWIQERNEKPSVR